MLKILFINNLIAVAIHVCICLLLMLPIGFTWSHGVWWKNISPDDIWLNMVIVYIFTIGAFFLYFWFGRKFLNNAENTWLSILSVAMVSVIIIIFVLIAFSNLNNHLSIMGLLAISTHPISETISYFFRIELKYAYMTVSIIPSVSMCIGIMFKARKDGETGE